MYETKKVYYINAYTGCSCCASQNFEFGFYFNKEDAQATIDRWSRGEGNPLSSQYARYGIYHLSEAEAELLPDGRVIIEDSTVSHSEDWPERIEW